MLLALPLPSDCGHGCVVCRIWSLVETSSFKSVRDFEGPRSDGPGRAFWVVRQGSRNLISASIRLFGFASVVSLLLLLASCCSSRFGHHGNDEPLSYTTPPHQHRRNNSLSHHFHRSHFTAERSVCCSVGITDAARRLSSDLCPSSMDSGAMHPRNATMS